jgi:hypothetical protein
MSLLSRLFRGKAGHDAAAPAGPGEDYHGCRITPTPIKEGGQYRIAARIEKVQGDQTLRHDLIRADTVASLEEATNLSLAKARQVIDQLGDGLFR